MLRWEQIAEQWHRMGQLYASRKTGQVTASVALKRLLKHVSPIEWDNVVLYGQYILDRKLVRRRRRSTKGALSV
jgi:hypothetical protein